MATATKKKPTRKARVAPKPEPVKLPEPLTAAVLGPTKYTYGLPVITITAGK